MREYKLYAKGDDILSFLYPLANGKRRQLTLYRLNDIEKNMLLFFCQRQDMKSLNMQLEDFKHNNKERYEISNYDD